jgi:hypothetical protein
MPDFKPPPCLFPRVCLTLRDSVVLEKASVDEDAL